MTIYYVNRNAQNNGDHEVHKKVDCPTPASFENQLSLGDHSDCQSAVKKARNYYNQVNGCYYCCNPCHTG